jgi:transcriptional regulator with XRE-family HTH domain
MSEGKKLKAIRMKLRLSQKELADLLGLQAWIPAWEGGSFPPPPFIWLAMAKLENQREREKQSGLARRSPGNRRRNY